MLSPMHAYLLPFFFFFPFQILVKEIMPNVQASKFLFHVALRRMEGESSLDSVCYLKEKKWDVSGYADFCT